MLYDVRCPDGHVNELYFSTISRADEAFKAGVECPHIICSDPHDAMPCGQRVERLITNTNLVKYNCGGFYGSIPTVDAHATGQV